MSGTGKKAMEELADQTRAIMSFQDPVAKVYPHQIAFNCLPHIDVFLENGYTKEEMKMVWETKKIMGDDSIAVTATTIRVPVFRKHRGDQTVHSQQRARIAAYCHLIETCEGSRAPFGLVLFAGSYDAVLVPNSRSNKNLLDATMVTAQSVLRRAAERQHPEAPAKSCCRSCPLGSPVAVSGMSVTSLESNECVYPVVGLGGQRFNSACGDRFLWIPPHERAERLRLEKA